MDELGYAIWLAAWHQELQDKTKLLDTFEEELREKFLEEVDEYQGELSPVYVSVEYDPDYVALARVCTCETEDIEEHTCPYSEELYGDEKLCNCCDSCTYQCAMDI